MRRALLLLPLLLLVWLGGGFVWRLIKPSGPVTRAQVVSQAMPAFTLPQAVTERPALSAADFSAGGPRLLNLFASWCAPCIAEAPLLAELRRRGARIDGIAVRDTPGGTAAFLDRHGNPYDRIGADRSSRVQRLLGSAGVPETFVIDGRGIIRFRYTGPIQRRDLDRLMSELEAAR